MREPVPPAGCVLGRHRGHDLCGVGVGHRPQHALADDRMGGADHVGGDAGSGGGEDLGGRLGVEPADQRGEPGRVEVVHGRPWGGELHGMTPLGGQVQVGPRDDVLAGARRQSTQAESPQHPAEADFDADKFEPVVRGAGEYHVGDPRESLPHNVDDLGVEHVAHQQDLVVTKRIGGRGDRECGRVIGAVCQDTGVLEALDRGPRHQQVRRAVAPHEESLDQVRAGLLAQADRQIGNAAERPPVGTQHVLAGHPAERQHSRSMPECPPNPHLIRH